MQRVRIRATLPLEYCRQYHIVKTDAAASVGWQPDDGVLDGVAHGLMEQFIQYPALSVLRRTDEIIEYQ